MPRPRKPQGQKFTKINTTLPPDVADWLESLHLRNGERSDVLAQSLRLLRTISETHPAIIERKPKTTKAS